MDNVLGSARGPSMLHRVDARLAAALSRAGGVVEIPDLLGRDLPRRCVDAAVRRGELIRVAPGVLADPAAWRAMDPAIRHVRLVRRALRRAGAGTAVGGASAAVIWGIPVSRLPDRVETVRPRSSARPERGGSTGWSVGRRAWVPEEDVVEIHGTPVTSLARTVVDVARSAGGPWALAAMDAARRRGLTAEVMQRAVARAGGVPGVRTARWAMAHCSSLPESPLESVARGIMLLSGVADPEPQVWLGDGTGPRYRVDLLVREYRTVVEVDGRLKYRGDRGPDVAWEEKRRRDRVRGWGYEVERFVAADEHEPDRWVTRLLDTFARSARRHALQTPLPHPVPRSAWHGNYS